MPFYSSIKLLLIWIPLICVVFKNPVMAGDNHTILSNSHEEVPKEPTLLLDDILQYTPAASVYVLNAFGVKGKHDFWDRSIILGTSYIIMGSTVYSLKKLTRVERPDKTSFDSFPSGHVAISFMGAEFLRREYWDVSPWFGIAGYTLATTTAVLRVYNKRHWPIDVVASVGIGILSTGIAYWVHPKMMDTLFPGRKMNFESTLAPFFMENGAGVYMVFSF
jgi:hypothetical protein